MVGMLIFQRHLPHLTPNSMQALRALSHSEITFWKAPFSYQHISLMLQLMTRLPKGRFVCRILRWVMVEFLECTFVISVFL